MADLVRYIDTTAGGGGDGTSGSPWDAWDDVEADDPGTASDTLEVEVSGGDDGSQMIVSGLSVPTITITPTDDNYRVNRTASNYSAAVVFDGKNVTVTGAYPFRVRQGATGGRRAIDIGPTSGNTVSIDKMIVQHEGGGSAFAAVNVDHAGTTLIKNSIVTTSISDGFNVTFGGGSGNLRVHNCLANDCAGDGFNRAGGTLNAVNCVSGNNTGNDFDGSFASKTDCASEDTTGTTGHQSITWADQFTDYTTDDFTLKSGNDLEGNGTDLDSDATLPVTEDIAGTARPATAPAIGPYEPAGVSGVTLVMSDVSQAQAADNVALTQAYSLTTADVSQAQSADNVALVQGYQLTAQDVTQSQSADNIALSQSISLALQDVSQTQLADGLVLVQANVLAVSDALQGQTADNVALSQSHSLTVADVAQGQAADALTLSSGGSLIVADVSQTQTADNLALSQSHTLSIQDVAQAVNADAIVLATGNQLSINDVGQAQIADSIALSQAQVLAVADALQNQSADSVALSFATTLAINDVLQAQGADALTLIASNALTVDDVSQSQSADNTELLQGNILALADVLQGVSADSVVLFEGDLKVPASRVYAVPYRTFTYRPPATNRTYKVTS